MTTESENLEEFLEIEGPHRKGPLTTPFGRLIDEMSYARLFFLALAVLTSATVYFYVASPHGHGIVTSNGTNDGSLLDALYFTIVTFTTLGYGDLVPHGFGRVICAMVVFSGLSLVALFVGKVASERQYSMLLLLHTSDCQRRLQGFCDDLRSATKAVSMSCETANTVALRQSTKEMANLLQAIFKYVVFHLNQSRLTEFGNESSLTSLSKELLLAQTVCAEAFKSKAADEVIGNRTLAIVKRLASFEQLVIMFQQRTKTRTRLSRFFRTSLPRCLDSPSPVDHKPSRGSLKTNLTAASQSPMREQADRLVAWAREHITSWLLSRVYEHLPSGPRLKWPRHEHKRIASELKVSNTVAEACISQLIAEGRIE
ncbi:potassium channel family protein [Paraburkholderia sp. Ac-20342]|uniref:potassium channel family protein n=1 Tax=Paraburkholderia sp. Ac-20342 TaxID=2703889 RepID=UPI00197EC9FD|nr:potassium channel family protein [Paraburkholderia sp. Ac-20342]